MDAQYIAELNAAIPLRLGKYTFPVLSNPLFETTPYNFLIAVFALLFEKDEPYSFSGKYSYMSIPENKPLYPFSEIPFFKSYRPPVTFVYLTVLQDAIEMVKLAIRKDVMFTVLKADGVCLLTPEERKTWSGIMSEYASHTLNEGYRNVTPYLNAPLPAPQATSSEGIFFEGQIFDAYVSIANFVKSAKKSIVLVDNYIDESVLTILSKRNSGVDAIIYTSKISSQLKLDLEKHDAQYPPITINTFKKSHDRFLIIDDTVYHFGASLKDFGRKWSAFSKTEFNAAELLHRIETDKPKAAGTAAPIRPR